MGYTQWVCHGLPYVLLGPLARYLIAWHFAGVEGCRGHTTARFAWFAQTAGAAGIYHLMPYQVQCVSTASD